MGTAVLVNVAVVVESHEPVQPGRRAAMNALTFALAGVRILPMPHSCKLIWAKPAGIDVCASESGIMPFSELFETSRKVIEVGKSGTLPVN